MLKSYDGPYFLWYGSSIFIKLKKDYIPGLGDAVDFVIIGGRRYARDVQALRIRKL